jgi:hypothetical protein
MTLNILEKAVHALKKAVEELEGQAGNTTKIREVARNLEPVLEPVSDVVLKLEGELKCISLGRIPDELRELAEAPEKQFNHFLHALRG